MDKKEVVALSLSIVLIEISWRLSICNDPLNDTIQFKSHILFTLSYLLCLVIPLFKLNDLPIFQTTLFKQTLSIHTV